MIEVTPGTWIQPRFVCVLQKNPVNFHCTYKVTLANGSFYGFNDEAVFNKIMATVGGDDAGKS
jgi:hypothetical protein